MEAAEVIHVHRHDIVIAALVAVNPPYEHLLCGSAIVESVVDDATIRAVLDATNRWLAPSTRDSDAR
jgi:hypothetical protein